MTTLTAVSWHDGLPVHRTAADEAADHKDVVDNLRDQAWKSWPNAAGFDGLTEHRGPIELIVTGTIPSWAAGALYRTGPGACKVEGTPKGTFYIDHWFDGFAHSHKFDIVADDGGGPAAAKARVFYSSRRQSDRMMADIKTRGTRKLYSFAQKRDPCIGIFGKFMSMFEKSKGAREENLCVAVAADIPRLPSRTAAPKPVVSGHRPDVKSIWVTTDNSSFLELDLSTLEPVGYAKQSKLHPDLKGPVSCSHAQRDFETGDYFNYNLEFGRSPTYRIFRVSARTGKTEILATISDLTVRAAYIHSFFITQNHVILCVPVSHFTLNGMKMLWEKNMLDSMDTFNPENKCKWFVVDRRHGKGVVAQFETPASFFFHSVNAWEEPSADDGFVDLFFDSVRYANLDIIHAFYYNVLLDRKEGTARFWESGTRLRDCHSKLVRYRYRLAKSDKALATQTTTLPELLCSIDAPHIGELPTINEAYAQRKHRYVYSVANRGLSTMLDALVKTDIETKEAVFWGGPKGHTPGEAIFVPRPAAEGEILAEDDGVLLSIVLDGSSQRSYLLCLDARTMEEMGRADCDFAVPLGLHGMHAKAI